MISSIEFYDENDIELRVGHNLSQTEGGFGSTELVTSSIELYDNSSQTQAAKVSNESSSRAKKVANEKTRSHNTTEKPKKDEQVENALRQYFVEGQVLRPADKFLDNARGCEDVSWHLLRAGIQSIPCLEGIKNTIKPQSPPVSNEDMDTALAAIHGHYHMPLAQEVTPQPRKDVATMTIDDLNTITPYEESLLQVAEDYVASLPECMSMDYDLTMMNDHNICRINECR